MLTDKELQTLRNIANEPAAAADEIETWRDAFAAMLAVPGVQDELARMRKALARCNSNYRNKQIKD